MIKDPVCDMAMIHQRMPHATSPALHELFSGAS